MLVSFSGADGEVQGGEGRGMGLEVNDTNAAPTALGQQKTVLFVKTLLPKRNCRRGYRRALKANEVPDVSRLGGHGPSGAEGKTSQRTPKAHICLQCATCA